MPGKTKMPSHRDARTCQACGGTSNHMYACSRCYLATYCSQRCCERDWNNHKDDCKFVTWHRKHAGFNFCHNCFAHACPHATSKLKRCGGCLRVSYCSKKCQENDWIAHVAICTGKKNMKSKETLLNECLAEQLREEDERAAKIAKEKGKEKADLEDIFPYIQEHPDSPFTKKERLQMELKSQRQKGLYQKIEDRKILSVKEGDIESDIDTFEKNFVQKKRVHELPTKPGQPIAHAIQETHYRIRISNKPPKMHDGYVKNADNTNTFEEQTEERQPDGSVIIRKTFTANGVIENDAQLEEIARQFGDDFTFKSGLILGTEGSD